MPGKNDPMRFDIFNSMVQFDGNRAKAADKLGVSIRTFYRYIADYHMDEVFDRCGWTRRPGPQRSIDRDSKSKFILDYVRKRGGVVDIVSGMPEMLVFIEGENTLQARRTFAGNLENLEKMGHIVRKDGKILLTETSR